MATKEGDFIPLNSRRTPNNVVTMPPSSYRPSPPSSRPAPPPPARAEPNRSQIDMPFEPPKQEPTLRSKPEAPEVVTKKKPTKVTAETRSVAVARVEKLISAGNPAGEAHAAVAKELGVSESSIYNWRTAARKNGAAKPAKKKATRRADNGAELTRQIAEALEESPLDIALDLLRLADRAKAKLGSESRRRLLSELQARLS